MVADERRWCTALRSSDWMPGDLHLFTPQWRASAGRCRVHGARHAGRSHLPVSRPRVRPLRIRSDATVQIAAADHDACARTSPRVASVSDRQSREGVSHRMLPYLSIVITGRNDNFGGDFNQRLLAAAAYNHQLLSGAGVEYELVFVEWRPARGGGVLVGGVR